MVVNFLTLFEEPMVVTLFFLKFNFLVKIREWSALVNVNKTHSSTVNIFNSHA
jgi:hypothetical protein